MSHYIVQQHRGAYLYPRRPISNEYPGRYMSRSSWGPDRDQARVFTSRSAATQAGDAAHRKTARIFKVIEVSLVAIDDD